MTMVSLTKQEPEWAAIHRIADSLDPTLQQTLMRALQALRGKIPIGRLTELIAAGDIAGALAAANVQIPDLTPRIQRVLGDAVRRAGQHTAQQLTGLLGEGIDLEVAGVRFSFNLTDPRVVHWAERHAATLVTEVTRETKQAIRQIVAQGIISGRPPRQQALAIREIVGLTRRDAGAVDKFYTGLIEEGWGEDRAAKEARRYHDRLLRRRAENIARTETMTAANRGQQMAWEQATEQGWLNRETIRRVWIATEDDRTCPRCMSLDDTTVELNESFREADETAPRGIAVTTLTPPLHPGCRCALGLVEVASMG